MDTSFPRLLSRLLTLMFAGLMLMGADDCGQRQPTLEDGNELTGALRTFHKNLRWARYDDASRLVAVEYQQTFLGRYEELGEDFHMISLEVTKVTMESDEKLRKPIAIVEVEQEWYIEPDMTVKKEKFIERWQREQTTWLLQERVEKEEWREREKEKKAEAALKATQEQGAKEVKDAEEAEEAEKP